MIPVGGDYALKNYGTQDVETINLANLLSGNNDKLSVADAYGKQAWIRRCTHVRANALAGVPWQITNGKDVVWDSEGTEPEGMEALWPLPFMLFMWEAALALEGQAYSLKLRKNGEFTGLQWWSPLSVDVVYDRQKGVVGFRRGTNYTSEKVYKKEDVLHFFSPDPYKEIGPGGADAVAARVHGDVLMSLATFADKYLDRNAIRAGLLMVDPATTKDDAKKVESWYNRFFRGGKKGGGRVKVFRQGKIEKLELGDGLSELADVDLTDDQRKSIAAAFGIPYSIVAPDAANFATKQGDQLDFYDHTAWPSCKRMQYALNLQLFGPMGLRFEFQKERVPHYQRLFLDTAKAYAELVNTIYTRDEVRQMLGSDPLGEPAQAAQQELPDEDEETDMIGKAIQDVALWRKKVARKGPGVKFESDAIPDDVQRVIRRRLEIGEGVQDAFSPPYDHF